MMNSTPVISIVLGTFNRSDFLKLAIKSIRLEARDLAHEILVVDGGSTDGTIAWLSEQKDIVTIVQHNHGTWEGAPVQRRSWGAFMNLAFKAARAKYVCMLSDDCLVVKDSIRNGVKYFDSLQENKRKVGALAFFYRDYPYDVDYKVHRTFGEKITVNHGLYLRHALEEVGYIEENKYRFYCADTDLCLKLWQRGYECLASPDSYIEHCHILKTRKRDATHARDNFSTENADLASLQRTWSGYFPGTTSRPVSEPLVRRYVDPTRTADLFTRHLPLRLRIAVHNVRAARGEREVITARWIRRLRELRQTPLDFVFRLRGGPK